MSHRGLLTFVSLFAVTVPLAMSGPALAAQTVCTPAWSSSETSNTTALQNAINTCSTAGTASQPGLVDLTTNNGISTAQISAVTLKSNIVVKVEAGFTLKGPNPPDVGYTGSASTAPPSMLEGSGLSNVTITGTGTLDGNGQPFWTIYNNGATSQSRPRIIKLTGAGLKVGANFTTLGTSTTIVTFPTSSNSGANALKIKNSPNEQLTFQSGSTNILVDGVWIYAPTGRGNYAVGSNKNSAPNTDGIDLIGVNSSNSGSVTIQNCLIDTGDDDIAIKSNNRSYPTYGVHIQNCVFGGGHGLSIGGQETGGVNNTNVNSVWFKGTDYGFRIKTDNTSTDTGVTSGATYTNSCMLSVGVPVALTYLYNGTSSGGASPTIKNVTVNNLIATSASTAGQSAQLGFITGLVDDALSQNIQIINTSITGASATPFTVTYGSLQLGSNSIVPYQAATGGSVSRISDSGPSVSCPSSIVIPAQQ